MARYSLDAGDRVRYQAKADEWEGRALAAGQAAEKVAANIEDAEKEARIARRIEGARALFENLHSMTAEEIAAQAAAYAARLEELRKVRNVWDSRDVYRREYAAYVEGMSVDAPITIEDFTKVDGHELQIAQWFSGKGVRVHLRNANAYKDEPGGNTSDAEMLGMLFDFKRITSKNEKQIGTNIRRKLETQGPGFVVDVSLSPMSLEDAKTACAGLLENERIERIVIIKDDRAIILGK